MTVIVQYTSLVSYRDFHYFTESSNQNDFDKPIFKRSAKNVFLSSFVTHVHSLNNSSASSSLD